MQKLPTCYGSIGMLAAVASDFGACACERSALQKGHLRWGQLSLQFRGLGEGGSRARREQLARRNTYYFAAVRPETHADHQRADTLLSDHRRPARRIGGE